MDRKPDHLKIALKIRGALYAVCAKLLPYRVKRLVAVIIDTQNYQLVQHSKDVYAMFTAKRTGDQGVQNFFRYVAGCVTNIRMSSSSTHFALI